jgi:MFS family permease
MPLQYYHQVWLVLIFGWVSNYMVRVALSPVLLPLMQEFSLSYAQAGLLASAVFYSYALMQFPAGYLGDRFGKKRILILCILGWGLCSLAMAAAASFAALLLVRFLTGLAQGTYFSNDRPIIAYYTPKEKAGIGQGISFMGLGLGMWLGILLAGWISDHWGWLTGLIKDATASFAFACYGAAVFAVMGAVVLFSVRPAFRWKPEVQIQDLFQEVIR